jgi:predicted GIY-YIG superfamily endonuclease
MNPDWVFYILRCCDNSLYCGITNCLEKRVKNHNEGKGARYTASRKPVSLVFSERHRDEASARKREAQVKNWPKKKKEALVAGGEPMNANGHIEALFSGWPVSLKLFQMVRDFIESLGPVTVTPTKTQVSFGVRRQFAWVWLPQMWISKQPENSIVLSFSLDRHVTDRRIKRTIEPYPGRWMHHVVIERPEELDEKLKDWLREAYASAAAGRRRKLQP